jgi:hypothetical protein
MSKMKRLSTADQALLRMGSIAHGKALAAAIAPLDQVAHALEAKWGCDRLPRLVTPELAARFGQAADKLDAAIHDNDLEAITHRAQVMIRGWQALDQAATEAGHTPMPPNTWSMTWHGKPYTVALNPRDADAVARHSDHPETVVTLPELLLAWSQWQPAAFAEAAKAAFPGATVQPAQKVTVPDDEIPF